MKTLAYFPEADEEVQNALNVSPKADEFRQAIQDALDGITSGRITHALVGRGPYRECVLTGYPYSIIYAETDTAVRVVAFPHGGRKPGSWKRRLPKN